MNQIREMSKCKETPMDKSVARTYSDSITKRRKALFTNTTSEVEKVDLSDSFKPLESDDTWPLAKNTGKYVILEQLIDAVDIEHEPNGVNESNLDVLDTSTDTSPAKSIIDETPCKESPTQRLKTPNETSTAKSGFPKLIRKSILDSSYNENGKRPTDTALTSHDTSESQPSKLSKIRTALFPDDIVLPARSFYPTKTETTIFKKSPLQNIDDFKKKKKDHGSQYICNRSRKSKRFGSINSGVRHKIKKPKRKSLKTETVKAAIKLTEELNKNTEKTTRGSDIETSAMNLPITTDQIVKSKSKGKEHNDMNQKYVIELNLNYNNKKRSISPDNSNEKRKFFKSSRNAVIVVDKHLKAQVISKDISKQSPPPSSKDLMNVSDFSRDGEFGNNLQIENILNVLSDKENVDNSNLLSKSTDNAVGKGRDDASLMSPTSEMCDLTLSLAINSPKRAKLNITKLLENESNEKNVFNKFTSSDNNEKKYYSIFTSTSKMDSSNKENATTNTNLSNKKKWKTLPANQMILDAGQKRFGLTQCPECEFVYNMGHPNEEQSHFNHHNGVDTLRFPGWKHEKVVNISHEHKIVKVSPGDSKTWWNKVHDVLNIINRDLGFYEMVMNTEKSVVYLYVTKKQIVGCLVAEPIQIAYKMLESEGDIDMCSREGYPVKCGISRIWVKKECRRVKLATALVNCLRVTFMAGGALERHDLAFSSPTLDGKQFAKKYCDSPNFYVYM